MTPLNIIDYAIIITLLFTIEPSIEYVIDNFCDLVIKFIEIMCDLVTFLIKICAWLIKKIIKISFNSLMVTLRVLGFTLFINIIVNILYHKKYITYNIFNIMEEEQNDLIKKIYDNIYKNYTY